MGGESEYTDVQVDFQSCAKLVQCMGERAVWSIGRGFGDKEMCMSRNMPRQTWGQSPGVENKEDTRSDQWTVKVRSGKSL